MHSLGLPHQSALGNHPLLREAHFHVGWHGQVASMSLIAVSEPLCQMYTSATHVSVLSPFSMSNHQTASPGKRQRVTRKRPWQSSSTAEDDVPSDLSSSSPAPYFGADESEEDAFGDGDSDDDGEYVDDEEGQYSDEDESETDGERKKVEQVDRCPSSISQAQRPATPRLDAQSSGGIDRPSAVGTTDSADPSPNHGRAHVQQRVPSAPPSASTVLRDKRYLPVAGSGKSTAFKCSFCEKTFPKKCKLVRHLTTHTGEKPFVCPEDG